MKKSHFYLVLLLFALPCLGQQVRVVVLQDEPIFYQQPNGSLAGIAHDTFQGVLQILQSKFNRSVTPQYFFTDTVEDFANIIVNNQAGISLSFSLPSFPPHLPFYSFPYPLVTIREGRKREGEEREGKTEERKRGFKPY